MTLPYLLRLVCLSLATFCGAFIAANLVIHSLSRRAIRRAETLPAKRAALALLCLRLFPAAFALFCVFALCIPSYVWLEPHAADEAVGIVCLIAGALATALWAISISHSVRAAVESRRFLRACELEMPKAGRVLALAGIVRPRVIVSREILSTLSSAELDAALRHELAHRTSRDNLKHLLILLSPGIFLKDLEQAWKRFSEWAADDLAVADDAGSAVELAAALVAVARLKPGAPTPALATTLAGDDEALSARVERLLVDRPRAPESNRRLAYLALAAIAIAAPLAPVALAWVHGLLERLMD